MAKQIINIGSGELAGDGESLRSAFDKVNDNFSNTAELAGATFTGDVDIESDLSLRDDDKIKLGGSLLDTVLLHSDQGFGLISDGTELRLRAPTVKLMSNADVFLLGEDDTNGNPKVSLNYNNSERLVTTSDGIDVQGNAVVTGFVQFGSLTTAERDALTAANGMVIYNTTDNKFQGRENGVWVNLV